MPLPRPDRHRVSQRPVRVALRFGAVLLACFIGDVEHFPLNAAEPESPSDLVKALNDDSYHTRETAEKKLLRLLARQEGGTESPLLMDALQHESMEVRHRARSILQKLERQSFDEQLLRLADPHCAADSISLPGWKCYFPIAGQDSAARLVFERLSHRFPTTLRAIHEQKALVGFDSDFDPYRISSEDVDRWIIVLLSDQAAATRGASDLSHRIINALCSSGLGPRSSTTNDTIILRRLVTGWVMAHRHIATPREHLLIAMRYQAYGLANEICERVLSNHQASPSSQVVSLLVAQTLQRSDLDAHLRRRLDDDRTAHVWQLIASRQTRIRTQIRDVALALLLHRQGIDPREVGFTELQADPLLVFRDHSLGFASDESREAAYAKSQHLLGL